MQMGAAMNDSTIPESLRIARKSAALAAAGDELTRTGYAALLETSPILIRHTARMFCAVYGPATEEEEVEAGFDNLPV